MSLSVNCSQSNVVKPNFRGSYQRTENGTPYYKTNSGTIAGAVMAVPAGGVWLANLSNSKTIEFLKNDKKNAKNLSKNEEELLKTMKKRAIPCAIIAAGMTLGCGMLVDALRNKKAQEKAEFIKQVGTQKAIAEGDNLALSNSGKPFYESNQGKKYGFGLGAVCGLAAAIMSHSKYSSKSGIVPFISNAITFGLGGLLMGAIADHNTNNDAQKHA